MLRQILRAVEDLAETGGHVENPILVVAARLKQEHPRTELPRETRRGDAAGAAAADDYVVVLLWLHRYAISPVAPCNPQGSLLNTTQPFTDSDSARQ